MAINYKLHEKGERPWGQWEVVSLGAKYIVKKIQVNPNASLSLQLHHQRGEHWIITAGNPTVTIGETQQELSPGKAVDIPKETKHRIENKTQEPVEFIEIQMGDVLDERDIVRFEDRYNRVTCNNSGR
jgi:mannose-1-phosphate guanylyltransferase/mannose-6-phosphate isomerase